MGLRDKYAGNEKKPSAKSESRSGAVEKALAERYSATEAPSVEELRSKLRGKGLGKVNPPEAADAVSEEALAPRTGPNGESPEQAPAEAPKKGRGRPAGSKNKPPQQSESPDSQEGVSSAKEIDPAVQFRDLVKVLREFLPPGTELVIRA